MEYEKVYELDDGSEYVLIEKMLFNSKRYLLLSDSLTNDIYVAYEHDDNLNILDEDSSEYNTVFPILYKKYNDSLTN